jgi:hypothetical protein
MAVGHAEQQLQGDFRFVVGFADQQSIVRHPLIP